MKPDAHYAKILRVLLKEDVTATDGWLDPLQGYLNSLEEGESGDAAERRYAQRQPVELEAVIRLRKKGNEVIYLPAIMKNISALGLMLDIQDKGHIMVSGMEDVEQFLVSFVVPGEAEPVTVECRPTRLEVRELVGVGARFISLEGKPTKFVM